MMYSQLRSTVVVALCLAGTAGRAFAQCADGSPPPCRSQTVAAAPVRRANPPLDEHTWIVVPFDNLSKTPDVDWLRVGAVNLLYLDMSRWRDIRVVDDERVTDLMREVPEARSDATPISLNAGIAVAKRAGAGRLVMGDVLKIGTRTTVTAKIFDVKTGQRLRSVREETAVADSVMPLFSKLARKILDLAPPAGANLGALGTSSIEAYQQYITGVDALSRYDLRAARARFEQALRTDSTFALAHYKLAIVVGWQGTNNPAERAHAEAANRLSAGLPPRERALIAGLLQVASAEWTKSCETFGALLKADSADVEAWYGLGDCLFHDPTMDAVRGDSTRRRFRGDWTRSIAAFSRVLQLDPANHLAYQHIIDALASESRSTPCIPTLPPGSSACYRGMLIRRGDSLSITPYRFRATGADGKPVTPDTAEQRQQNEDYLRSASRRQNLNLARTYAEAWVQSSPAEPQAHRALARILVQQGQLDAADAEMSKITAPGTVTEETRRLVERMEIAYKREGHGAEAIRLYDSTRTVTPVPGSPPIGNLIALIGPAFGRLVEFDSLMAANSGPAGASTAMQQYRRAAFHSLLMGMPHDSLIPAERAVFESELRSQGGAAATRTITVSLVSMLRAPRASWPPLDSSVKDPLLQSAIALSRGDTAALRRSAQALDSIAAFRVSAGVADEGQSALAADSYLILRDSASALRSLRFMLEAGIVTTPFFSTGAQQLPFVVPRAMLLRADLAAAAGQRSEARTWYKRFLEVWATASPELQPLVERARKSLAALGGIS